MRKIPETVQDNGIQAPALDYGVHRRFGGRARLRNAAVSQSPSKPASRSVTDPIHVNPCNDPNDLSNEDVVSVPPVPLSEWDEKILMFPFESGGAA